MLSSKKSLGAVRAQGSADDADARVVAHINLWCFEHLDLDGAIEPGREANVNARCVTGWAQRDAIKGEQYSAILSEDIKASRDADFRDTNRLKLP